jgi:hypothetical protein
MSPALVPTRSPTPGAGPVTSEEKQTDASSSAVGPVDDDLRERVHRLEAVVSSMRAAMQDPCPAPVSQVSCAYGCIVGRADEEQSVFNNSYPAPTSSLSRSLSIPINVQKQPPLTSQPDCFWTSLLGEVGNVAWAHLDWRWDADRFPLVVDQIEDPGGDVGSGSKTKLDTHSPLAPNASKMDDGGFRFLGLSGNNLTHTWTPVLEDKEMTRQLCQIYLEQVDPIIKILHRPSVEKWLLHGEQYLDYPERHVAVDALRSAICYAAAASLADEQCRAMFQRSRSSGIAEDSRRACEAALERSGLLASPSITGLQAFVLYLVSTSFGTRLETKTSTVLLTPWNRLPEDPRTGARPHGR